MAHALDVAEAGQFGDFGQGIIGDGQKLFDS